MLLIFTHVCVRFTNTTCIFALNVFVSGVQLRCTTASTMRGRVGVIFRVVGSNPTVEAFFNFTFKARAAEWT